MKDELWMRTWNDGQPRFSADLHRGILWMLTPFRRLGKHIAPRVAPGGDSVFTQTVPRVSGRERHKAG